MATTPIDDMVRRLPEPVRGTVSELRRRVNHTILAADLDGERQLTEHEVRAVRLGMTVIELRKMLVRGDLTDPRGNPAIEAIASLDALLMEVGLYAVVRRHSEDAPTLSVELATRAMIDSMRRLGS